MAALPVHVRVAQAVGITTASALAGFGLGFSFFTAPTILLSPSAVVPRQWDFMYERGKRTGPTTAVISAASFTYLTYALYKTLHHPKAELYGLAALSTVIVIPYTFVFMKPVNDKLKKKVKESLEWSIADEAVEQGAPKGESSKELVDQWATYNFIRYLFPTLGAAIGAWATLK